MAEDFDEKQTARIKEAGRELLEEMSAEKLATELGMRTVQILGMIRGNKAPSRDLAEGVARLLGLALEDLLGQGASAKPRAHTSESPPIVSVAITTAPANVEPESLSPSSPATLTYSTTHVDTPNPVPTPTTQPPISDAPNTEIKPLSRLDPNAPPPTPLQMIDAAAISMALDLFPRRREEIFREYGLTPEDGELEMAAWREHLEKNPRDRASWQSMREGSRNSWLRAEREKNGLPAATTKPSFDLPPSPMEAPPTVVGEGIVEPPLTRSSTTLATGKVPEPPTQPNVPSVVAQRKVDPTAHFTGEDVFAALSAFGASTQPTPPPIAPPISAPPPVPPTVVAPPPRAPPQAAEQAPPPRAPRKFDDRTMVLTKVRDGSPAALAPIDDQPAPPRKKFDEPTMKQIANAPRPSKSKFDDETMRALAPIAPPPPAPKPRVPIDPTIAMPPDATDGKPRK